MKKYEKERKENSNMKKYILLIIGLIWCLNACGNQEDKKYLEIKENKNIDELDKYYTKKREEELKRIFLKLDEFFKNNQDKKILKYLKEYDNYLFNILDYYSKKFSEKCNKNCAERLTELYNYLYKETDNIEILANILKYRKIIGEREYEKIKEICIKNNSIKAIKEDMTEKNNKIEKENINNEIKIDKKNYRIIQEHKIKSSITALLVTDKTNVYLIVIKNNKNIIEKIESYYDTITSPELKIIDLNNNGKNQFVIQYDRNIYIYNLENEKILKIFDGYKNISLNKYFKYKVDEVNVQTIISDDFKFNNIEVNKLPNEKEIISAMNILNNPVESKVYYSFAVIKNKIIMNIMDSYDYEVIFDEKYKYKIKKVNKKDI